MKEKILVTGAAGFIGFHLCKTLLKHNFNVIGVDNLNSYYDINLKIARLKEIETYKSISNNWKFIKCSLENKAQITSIFRNHTPKVINLAAQAGVRNSIENPSDI